MYQDIDILGVNDSTGSLFRLLAQDDISYSIRQRDSEGGSVLMYPRRQPLFVYQDLLNLGADAKALDHHGNTVLHHYFSEFWISLYCT